MITSENPEIRDMQIREAAASASVAAVSRIIAAMHVNKPIQGSGIRTVDPLIFAPTIERYIKDGIAGTARVNIYMMHW